MKIPKLPENIKIHPYALRDIKEISLYDKKRAGKIIQRIAKLGLDPIPNNEECSSKVIQNLKKYKIKIRRLRCMDISDYRVFYTVRETGMICVYAVVFAAAGKHDEAYREDSTHYKRIKLLSTLWGEC
jgi:mRNA-degrading endonuclease RelE of RelBE toxin-antitoxin system